MHVCIQHMQYSNTVLWALPSVPIWHSSYTPYKYVYTLLNHFTVHSQQAALCTYFIQEGDDINEEIAKTAVQAPCIIINEAREATTYDVVVEGASLGQSTDLSTALVDLFSAYFAFDIAYPQELHPVLIFQHYVFGLKDQQKVPVSVTTTVATMRWLD